MATLRQIKDRARAIEKIKKIAYAMEIVSLTRLKRIEHTAVDSRDYFEKIREIVFSLGKSLSFEAHPVLQERKKVKSIGVIALTSDKGLCGNFNNNIIKEFLRFSFSSADKDLKIFSIGKKGSKFFKKQRGLEIIAEIPSAIRQESQNALAEISGKLISMFVEGKIDEVTLIYNKFRLQFLGKASFQKLLPLRIKEERIETKDYIFEPDAFSVLDGLIKEYILNQIQQAIFESNAAQEMARMLAMKQACDNATELIDKLQLSYHKMRQAQITKELMEVVSAAEAL